MKRRLLAFLAIVFVLSVGFIKTKNQPVSQPSSSTYNKEVSKEAIEPVRLTAREIWKNCQDRDSICLEGTITTKLLEKYPTGQILSALYDWDQYFSCHAFSHFLGRALYRKTQSIADAYSQVDFTCHGGAYHGVMESFLDGQKESIDQFSGQELVDRCRDSTAMTQAKKDQIFTECLHGFGHAFMYITASDLPASLAYCDRLDEVYQERCWGGAFMENSTSSTNVDHPTQWLKADDKFYPCTILESRYLAQCYFYQANYLLKATNRDWQQVFADCAQLTDAKNHDYCVLGMGAQLASVSNEQGIDVASAVCQTALSQSDAYICIEGAVPSLFARYGGDAPQIFDFCQKAASFLGQFCFAKLGSVAKEYWQYDSSHLAGICQKALAYQNACLGENKIEFKY